MVWHDLNGFCMFGFGFGMVWGDVSKVLCGFWMGVHCFWRLNLLKVPKVLEGPSGRFFNVKLQFWITLEGRAC